MSAQAKHQLCEAIEHFIRDRIVMADRVIEAHAVSKINDGDVVLTYARCDECNPMSGRPTTRTDPRSSRASS
jgi:translation initiation factor 2B subunit (eIF-2B alpha/beta/delta family)